MRVPFRLAFLTLASAGCLLALGGCSNDSSSPTGIQPALSQNDADDLVQQIALNTLVTNYGSYVAGENPPPGATLARRGRLGPVAAIPSSAQWDTTITSGPLTFAFTVLLYDSLGNPMAHYDADSTWRITEQSHITGFVTGTNYLSSLEHTGTLTITGMRAQDDTATFVGTALDTAYSVFQSQIRAVTRYFHYSANRTIANVRVPKAQGTYPASGTITWVVTAQRLRSSSRADVEATVTGTLTLTFNGTPTPIITASGGWRYSLNLDTGAIARLTT
jgi:hypothetical protein